MINLQPITDKASITLSLLCAIHCLAAPFLLTLLPTSTLFFLGDEMFHIGLLIAILPLSAYSLTVGCKKHKQYRLLTIGFVGLGILLVAALFGHDFLGEFWEKTLTLVGSIIIAAGHTWNYILCQRKKNCGCTSDSAA